MTGTSLSRDRYFTVVAAWAVASAAAAAAAAVLSLGMLAYLLVASPIGQLLLWGVIGLAHWVAARRLQARAPGFAPGVVIGTLGGAALTLTIIPFISSLNLPAVAVLVTAIAASGLALGEGFALTEGLVRRGPLVLLHVSASAIGGAAGAALAISVGANAIGSDASTVGLIRTTTLAAVVGATAYGLASGCSVSVLLHARRQDK